MPRLATTRPVWTSVASETVSQGGVNGRDESRPSTDPVVRDEPEISVSPRVLRFAAAQDRDHHTRHTIDDQLTARNRHHVHDDQITAQTTAPENSLSTAPTAPPHRKTVGCGESLAHQGESNANTRDAGPADALPRSRHRLSWLRGWTLPRALTR